MASKKQKVMLLVTDTTPGPRVNTHRARLARMFHQGIPEIEVKWIDASCEVPSALVAEHGVWLFADSDVGSVAPDSTKLALDWATRWFIVRGEDVPKRTAPLYRCKLKPGR